MLLLIGGLSGAGKSELGRYLEKSRGFRWIELDRGFGGTDQVDRLAIRREWESFLAGDPAALIRLYPGATAVTIASLPIVRAPMYQDGGWVRVRYLTGAPGKCFGRANGRTPEIDRDHWNRYNGELLSYLRECPAEWKVNVFDDAGNARPIEDIADEVLGN